MLLGVGCQLASTRLKYADAGQAKDLLCSGLIREKPRKWELNISFRYDGGEEDQNGVGSGEEYQ